MKTYDQYNLNTPEYFAACEAVAQDWREIAHGIRKEDLYALHVTEEHKAACLQRALAQADKIAAGEIKSFAIWQRVNKKLTGECVGLLPAREEA